MSAIGAIRCQNALVMCADNEEIIPEALRTRGEKIHILPMSSMGDSWRMILAGAGDVDWTHMAKDLIAEKIAASAGNDSDIIKSIRASISEIWRDYARYSQSSVSMRLLIGSYSMDHGSRFTVVTDQAVREGRGIEAMGIGDATFRALADRYLSRYLDAQTAQIFCVYAMQQIKQTIPGVGGNTRIVTLYADGRTEYEKSFKIARLQEFFTKIHQDIQGVINPIWIGNPVTFKSTLSDFSRGLIEEIEKLQEDLEQIENSPSLT